MRPSRNSRVVVTGIGALTPLALTMEESWQAMLAGRSGVARITQFDASDLPAQIAGEVKGFVPKNYMDPKEARRMARCSQFAVAATQAALADAGISLPLEDPERSGVLLGTAAGGMDVALHYAHVYWNEHSFAKISPFAVPAALSNMPSHHASLYAGTTGPISTVAAACATGTQAVGEAAEFIRRGRAEMMIAGGVDGYVSVISIGGFCAMRGLSTRNDEPERASRPFDTDRDGFIYSEGAAVFILEELGHALARGARIYAEILGHASSSDAFHVARPDPDGQGAVRAMRWALEDAGVSVDDVDYINAHGSSTPINDVSETRAIKTLFGQQAYRVPISSTKSMIGHAMGAAGAIEAAVSILTIRDGIIHPTINLEHPDPECDLDYVPEGARRADVRVVLSNSFGLGGQNACLVVGRYEG